jgi:hypothetical protein
MLTSADDEELRAVPSSPTPDLADARAAEQAA